MPRKNFIDWLINSSSEIVFLMGKAVSDKTFGLSILITWFEIPFPCDAIYSICLLSRSVSFACLLANTTEPVVPATEVKA